MNTFEFALGSCIDTPEGPVEWHGCRQQDYGELAQLRVGDEYEEISLAQLFVLMSQEAPRATAADPGTDHGFMLQLTEEQREEVLAWERHLIAVRDGFPDAEGADRRYVETVKRARRVDHKAAELGVHR